MRYLVLLVVFVFTVNTGNAQIYELGIFAGGSNFIGDVGPTNYISPNQPAFGGIAKWNRSPRHAYRFSIIYTKLEGLDRKSDDPRRQQRDYAFENNLLEFSGGIEFTFFDFDQHDLSVSGTPYLYTGASVARHDNYFFTPGGTYTYEQTKSWAWGIPMALGYKHMISPNFILSAEVGARYTFTDEIDGSVPDAKERASLSFGNTNNNDWYVFTGITLTYTFGQKPCYCYF